MDVNSVTQPAQSQSGAAASSSEASTAISSDFETFLRMLTTQLENQDPLDPVNSDEFAVQLATFSGVEQQVLTNDLLESLVSQMGLSGMGQYASWVGMEARAAVPARFDGTPLTVVPQPSPAADAAVLVVENEFGTEVQRLQIPVSEDPIEWSGLLDSGPAPSGTYSFKVESYVDGLVTDTAAADVYARVTEARLVDGVTMLVTEGGGEVPASEVTALRQLPS